MHMHILHRHIYVYYVYAYPPLYLHARTHYSDAHTTCEKVPLRLFPKSHQNSSQSTLVLFTPPAPCFCSFHLLYHAIQNFSLPISPFKFSLPGVVPKSDSLPEFDSPRVNAHDVILCRQLRKQTDIRRRK